MDTYIYIRYTILCLFLYISFHLDHPTTTDSPDFITRVPSSGGRKDGAVELGTMEKPWENMDKSWENMDKSR